MDEREGFRDALVGILVGDGFVMGSAFERILEKDIGSAGRLGFYDRKMSVGASLDYLNATHTW